MPKNGFTLIELLVSITILGIAFGVVISSAYGIQKNGRDTQRQADLRALQAGLQQYYTDQNYFPTSAGGTTNFTASSTTLTSTIGNPTPPASVKTYMISVPKDPSNSSGYGYEALSATSTSCDNSTTTCQKYCIFTTLENNNGSIPSQCTATGTYNHALTQP